MKGIVVTVIFSIVNFIVQAQWVNTTSGTSVNLNDVYFISADTGFVAGDSLTIRKTVNGGNSWSNVTIDNLGLGASAAVKKITFNSNKTVGIAVGNFGNNYYFLRSTDGGNTWNKTSQITTFGINAVSFYDTLQVFAVGDTSELFYSGSAGSTWTLNTFNGFDRSITDISCKNGTCVACLTSGAIYKTTSANGSWNIIKQTDSINLKGIVLVNEDTILAVGETANNSYLLTSYNGGSNWLPPLNMQVENINDIFFPTTLTGFVVGGSPLSSANSQYIATTADAGFTWQQQNEATFKELNAVFFIDALNGFAVGDSGTIIKTTNGGITGIKTLEHSLAFEVFPNPVNDMLSVTIKNKKYQFAEIEIYNITSQKILSETLNNTNNVFEVNIQGLLSGMYFCRIVTDSGNSDVLRLIKH